MTDTKTIVCPHCGEALELPLGMESRNFQCPYCEMKFKLADCENKSLSSDLPMCKNESSQQKYQPRSSNDLPSRDALNFGGQLLTIKERANFACRRWQARIIDLAITGILYTILTGALVHFRIVSSTVGYFWMTILPIAFYFVCDTILLSTVKTTLGRSLSCLQYCTKNGASLSFQDVLKHNLTVWLSGFWCGVFAPIPWIYNYFVVRKHGLTNYDRKSTVMVIPMPYKSWRTFLSLGVIVFGFIACRHVTDLFPDIALLDSNEASLYERLEYDAKICLDRSNEYKRDMEKSEIWKLLSDKSGSWYVDKVHARENRDKIRIAKMAASKMLMYAEDELSKYGNQRPVSDSVKHLLKKHNDTYLWYRGRCQTIIKICDQVILCHIILLRLSGYQRVVEEGDEQLLSKYSDKIRDINFINLQSAKLQSLIDEYKSLDK